MTKFEDGPAAGKMLALKLSPEFLRVVRNRKGKFDALDKPNDIPGLDEEIYVYRLVKVEGHCHIRAQNFSGFFPIATYRLYGPPPGPDVLGSIGAWQKWCRERGATR